MQRLFNVDPYTYLGVYLQYIYYTITIVYTNKQIVWAACDVTRRMATAT